MTTSEMEPRASAASAGTCTAQHDQFDHVAVFHAGAADLAAQLSGWLPTSLSPSDAVLLCLDEPSTATVAALVASHSGPVTAMPADLRYQRPAGAMRFVHDFTRQAVREGADRVWSIGRIDFSVDDDGRWARYEAAVDDVLRHLPLVGVCAYDTGSLEPSAIDTARRTHRHVHDAEQLMVSAAYRPEELRTAASWWIPDGAPTAQFAAAEHAAARRAVAELAVSAGCPADRATDLSILTSELATNAVLHGAEPATVQLWRETDRIVVQAVDHGPGLSDAWPDLRPPAANVIGGLGLWLVGQLADRFHLARRADGATVITAAVELG